MSVVILPLANQVIRQFADFPDVDMRFASKAAFETAIVNMARIPDGWMAYCTAQKKWYQADKVNGVAVEFGGSIDRFEIGYACSDEVTNLSAGAAKLKDKSPYNFRLVSVQANVNTPATGSSIVVNIKKNGVTIFTTKLSIDASETSSLTAATPYVFTASPMDFVIGDDIQIDLDQVGIITAGIGLKVKLLGHVL